MTAANDPFQSANGSTLPSSMDMPATAHEDVTPDDNNDLVTLPRGIYIGVSGDVAMIMGGVSKLYKNMQQGIIYPLRPSRIKFTGTTATNIIAVH